MNRVDSTWQKCRRRAFWDRPNLSYEKWIRVIKDPKHPNHSRMIEQSFRHMPPYGLIHLIGQQHFVSMWPQWRGRVLTPHRVAYDYAWGFFKTGSKQFGFNENFLKLHHKTHRKLFDYVIKHEPINISQLAKALGRSYRRVFDGVKKLDDLGLFSLFEPQDQGRKTLLVSVPNVNDLDAMMICREKAP